MGFKVNSVVGVCYRKNVKRDIRGKIISESDNWHIGFATWEDYRKWEADHPDYHIIDVERYTNEE